jgi:hypothetical protein
MAFGANGGQLGKILAGMSGGSGSGGSKSDEGLGSIKAFSNPASFGVSKDPLSILGDEDLEKAQAKTGRREARNSKHAAIVKALRADKDVISMFFGS